MSDSRAVAEGRGGVEAKRKDQRIFKTSLGEPRNHQKVQRFFRKLSDDQVLGFIVALEKQLAATAQEPKALREAMIRYVASQP